MTSPQIAQSTNPLLSFDFSLTLANKCLINRAKGEVALGDSIMLFGQSGSGKSLLLSALAKLLPVQGTILFNNNPTIAINEYRHLVSLIHQTPYFLNGTVLENLRYVFDFSYHNNKVFDKDWHIAQLSKFHKDSDFLDKDIQMLSGGEKQLVNFLRTLQLNPKILLLDEPTAALDEVSTKTFFELFLTHQATHKTACIWISHNPDHLSLLSAQRWQLINSELICHSYNQ